MTVEQLQARYVGALHAMQTGIAYEIEKGVSKETEPKHQRVGINNALCQQGALVSLLIKQGVITEEAYWAEVVAMLEKDVRDYEVRLTEIYGVPIKLF